MPSSSAPDGVLAEVGPQRMRPGKPSAYSDRTRLLLTDAGLVVTGVRGERLTYPLAGEGRAAPDAVASLALSYSERSDKAGKVERKYVEVVNRDGFVLCRLTGALWDEDELRDFARRAGLRFSAPHLANLTAHDKAFPMADGAIQLAPNTRRQTVLGVAGVVVLLVIVFVLLFVL